MTASARSLFVYGSLKRGGAHHGELGDVTAQGACRTAARYALVVIDGYPALCAGDKAITGELYLVNELQLAALDRFEGENYLRQPIELSDGRVAEAYVLAEPGRLGGVPFPGASWPVD
jgi:gamma-glutamylcyclotransferase (GGCT)/AIG2-like uncharacterized protein YtfP